MKVYRCSYCKRKFTYPDEHRSYHEHYYTCPYCGADIYINTMFREVSLKTYRKYDNS